jgi:hypothetical protein
MKTLVKSGVFAVLMAALLIAALITGCIAPPEGNIGYTPSPGMGYVKLNISNNITRTILPETLDIEDIGSYKFTFDGIGPQVEEDFDADPTGQIDEYVPIELPAGTYTLTTVAFLDNISDGQLQPVATATNSVTITAGAGTPVTVSLKAFSPSDTTETGSFKYTIDYETDINEAINTATMTITPLTGGTDTHQNTPVNIKPLSPATSVTDTLTPMIEGFYYVDFHIELTVDSPDVTFRQVLHIYRNMETEFIYTFKDNHIVVTDGTVSPMNIEVDDDFYNISLEVEENIDGDKLEKGDSVTIYLENGVNEVTFTVTNQARFDTIEWYNGTTQLTGPEVSGINDSELTVDITLFDKIREYHITVIGIINAADADNYDIYSSLYFYVIVEAEGDD